jgi:hypothetical protein
MIGLQVFRHIPTSLEINGPILSFSQQPTATTINSGGSVTLVGIATAEFPSQTPSNPAQNTGYISYQWYEVGVGALSNSATITGTATTALTLSGLTNPTDTGRQFFLRADYVASAYAIGKSTPNAVNDPLDSDTVAVIVRPTVSITSQPSASTVAQGRSTTFTVSATTSDGSDSGLTYQWYLNGSPLSNGGTVSGANSNTLTISLSNVSTNAVYVEVSHPSAGNSPVTSSSVTYGVVSARSILNYELLDGNANQYGFGSTNLFDQSITFTANPSTFTRTLVVYAPEKDITVRMTMAASGGASRNGNRGGEGGISVFTLTLLQNQEYVFKLGAQVQPSGGLNGGGGGAFFYRKGQLLVALGGGGGAGNEGRGGDGGGVGIAGENGSGRSAGSGGTLFSTGALPVQGFFAGGATSGGVNLSATTGGRISCCTGLLEYWVSQGIAPCNDIGNVQFRGVSGQIASSSATILRGFKEGTAYRNNGGNASGDNGGAGSGAVGGNAGTGSGSGGGGGSGYTNGEVNIVNTRLGGNTSTEAYVTIEYLS